MHTDVQPLVALKGLGALEVIFTRSTARRTQLQIAKPVWKFYSHQYL